ncbi:uncharacterized protein ACR2FA_010012 [Aphomia sociella]
MTENEESALQESVDLKQEPVSLKQESVSLKQDTVSLKQDSERLQQESKDMMSMFASVWVKVEVDDEPSIELPNVGAVDIDTYQTCKSKKKRPRRFTKTMTCDICNYTTVYKNCLELHMLGHNNSKPYCCGQCEYTTKYPTALYRHVMIKHDNAVEKQVPIHKCDQCNYSSYFKWNLSAHKRKHKLEKQFKCEHCNYETAYRHNYLKHSKIHNDNICFKCDKCPFATKFEGHITRHLAKIHNEVIEKANKCDMCDFSTKTRWRLNVHRQRSKQEDVLKCAYCDFETSYMCESKKHKVTHYNLIYGSGKLLNNVQPALQEKSIDNIYEDVTDNMINDEMKFQNDTNLESGRKYLLDPNCVDWNSIQVLESEDKERPFQCHMCAYTSRFKASVQRHFQRHHTGTQNRPYKCINCDFSTKTKDQIALHNKRSQSDVQLFCAICKFTTHYKCQYVMHQKLHYMNKCPKCSYSCKHKYELQKHFATIHLGNGLKCQYCDYKAARKESLLCHETIHTGIKPFKCNDCDYMSVRRSLLNNHVKRYHTDVVSDVTVFSESRVEALKLPMESVDKFRNIDLECQDLD